MRHDQAIACMAMMQARFPNPEIPPSSVTAWALELEIFPEPADVEAALSLLVKNPPERRPIHISDVTKQAERIWWQRVEDEQKQQRLLPGPPDTRFCTFEEYLRQRPEMRDRLKKVGMFAEIVTRAEAT